MAILNRIANGIARYVFPGRVTIIRHPACFMLSDCLIKNDKRNSYDID